MIEVSDLVKRFGEKVAVQEVSFSASKGEILGVLGPNGAGKTTTLRILCGYLPPTSGAVRVGGIDVGRDSVAVRRMIGYLPENVPLYPEMRVAEYLRFRAGLKGVPRRRFADQLDRLLPLCGLSETSRQTIGTLSRGFRQRVGLADALIANPPVLVLDEPTAGLDPNQALEMRRLVSSLAGDHTVLLSSHLLNEVEQVCDRVVIFRKGQLLAEGTPAELQARVCANQTVTVEFPGDQQARTLPLLASLAQVQAVETLEDGWIRSTLTAETDPREAIFRAAAGGGLVLRELSRRMLSLEEIFHELTGGGASPSPASQDKPAAMSGPGKASPASFGGGITSSPGQGDEATPAASGGAE